MLSKNNARALPGRCLHQDLCVFIQCKAPAIISLKTLRGFLGQSHKAMQNVLWQCTDPCTDLCGNTCCAQHASNLFKLYFPLRCFSFFLFLFSFPKQCDFLNGTKQWPFDNWALKDTSDVGTWSARCLHFILFFGIKNYTLCWKLTP